MRTFLGIMVLALLNLTSANGGYITQGLLDRMASADPDELIRVNVFMAEQSDISYLETLTEGKSKSECRELVVSYLIALSSSTQAELMTYLESKEVDGSVSDIISLWLVNAINCWAASGVIEEIATWDDIEWVDWDELQNLLIPTETSPGEVPEGIVWNLEKIGAPDVWTQGYTGQGVVVGVLDTGVYYEHKDLEDHIWKNHDEVPNNGIDDDGNGYVDDYYGYNFASRQDPDWIPDPKDDHWHGTACAGVIAGDGTSGTHTGVAPDAQIMCVKVLNAGGGGTEGDVLDGMEYAFQNGAHVLSLSLGVKQPSAQRDLWRTACDNLLTARIIVSVGAGNEWVECWGHGNLCPLDNITAPGDVPPPWLHRDQTPRQGKSAVMAVGATDATDSHAMVLEGDEWSSSKGPVQ